MFLGFNLENITQDVFSTGSFDIGQGVFADDKARVHGELSHYCVVNGSLDALKMTADWFPEVRADVFISHSHFDTRTAVSLVGWLKSTFGLDAFVDSCVWGYADQLLKLIDDRYCFQHATNTYNYELRNKSTSHVHMILQTALMKMIDNTECIIFLNTPSSITPPGVIGSDVGSATFSPWLYSELAMTRLARKRSPERRRLEKVARLSLDEGLKVLYQTATDHLLDLSVDDLRNWMNRWQQCQHTPEDFRMHPLDLLYSRIKY